jgi:hypothetical protein
MGYERKLKETTRKEKLKLNTGYALILNNGRV